MVVTDTSSWYDEVAERDGASLLISRGAALIAQHAVYMDAPAACEAAGVPNVSYNGSTTAQCPKPSSFPRASTGSLTSSI